MEPAKKARKKKAILLELPCFPKYRGVYMNWSAILETFFEVDCGVVIQYHVQVLC